MSMTLVCDDNYRTKSECGARNLTYVLVKCGRRRHTHHNYLVVQMTRHFLFANSASLECDKDDHYSK